MAEELEKILSQLTEPDNAVIQQVTTHAYDSFGFSVTVKRLNAK